MRFGIIIYHLVLGISLIWVPPRSRSEMRWYLILGTWYREPFCHQMGQYQTLRGENWCTQLLVRFHVVFEFKQSENHLNGVQNSRNVLFWEKKSPCQECPGLVRMVFLPKSMDFHFLDQKIYPIPKMMRPKMMPWSMSIHWNAANLLFHKNN